MRFYAHERLALLVDGFNIWNAAHALNLEIDWGKVENFFGRQATLVSCLYFTALAREGDDGFQPMRPLIDWLSYNNWQVITSNKDTDVDLAVTAMEMAGGSIDHFILATGDGDFVMLVEALQRRGKRVTVLSALKAGSVSDELRRSADAFLDLEALRPEIARVERKDTVRA